MRIPEVLEGKVVVPLWPTTGRLLELSKNSTYQAANRGEIPIVRLGSKMMVPVAPLLEMLQIVPDPAAGAADAA